MHLNIFPKLSLISRKYKKLAIFDISETITLRVNIIHRQMTPFFSPNLWALSVGIFHFCFSRPSKFNSMGSPFALSSGLKNTHLHAKEDTFNLNTAQYAIFSFPECNLNNFLCRITCNWHIVWTKRSEDYIHIITF